MSGKLPSDEILFNLMKEGDLNSFNTLFERYWKKLYATVYSNCTDNEVCSEIVHDIFLKLWLRREKLQIGNFKAYITASARYQIYRHLKSVTKSSLEYREDLEFINQVAVNDGENNIHYRELERRVEEELEELPKRCKEIFTLSRKEQLTNEEIAKRLDISKRTVENQLTHALRHLRVSMRHFMTLFIILLDIS